MRKNAWVICCCTAVLAAFGTFFRWLQDQVCFEADTGLAVRGSIWPYAVALMIVIAAVVLAVVCFRMKNQPHTYFPDSLPAALAASPRVRTIGGIVLGALLAVGGLWLLLSSGALSEPGLQRVLAVLAVVTGVVFARQMLAPGERENDAGALVCASMPMARPARYERTRNTTHTAATNAMMPPQIAYIGALLSWAKMLFINVLLSGNGRYPYMKRPAWHIPCRLFSQLIARRRPARIQPGGCWTRSGKTETAACPQWRPA